MSLEPKQLAELTKSFAESELGEHYMMALSLEYNALHQAAEDEATIEGKAMKIERAAGLKIAIDWITTKRTLSETGYFKDK